MCGLERIVSLSKVVHRSTACVFALLYRVQVLVVGEGRRLTWEREEYDGDVCAIPRVRCASIA